MSLVLGLGEREAFSNIKLEHIVKYLARGVNKALMPESIRVGRANISQESKRLRDERNVKRVGAIYFIEFANQGRGTRDGDLIFRVDGDTLVSEDDNIAFSTGLADGEQIVLEAWNDKNIGEGAKTTLSNGWD